MKRHAPSAIAAFILIAIVAAPTSAEAKPWIASADGVEVNWASLTARFDGLATSGLGDREGLKGLERTAWRNGYEKAGPALDRILRDQFVALGMQDHWRENGDETLAKARDQVKKSVKSLSATFFASGAIEVSMEAALQAGFANALQRTGAGTRNSGRSSRDSGGGLILKLPVNAGPSVAFWIVDPTGKVLFDPGHVSGAVLAQGSMGRWFRGEDKDELARITGKKPETLVVSEVRTGNRLVVDPSRFGLLREETLRALSEGKVALVGQ